MLFFLSFSWNESGGGGGGWGAGVQEPERIGGGRVKEVAERDGGKW